MEVGLSCGLRYGKRAVGWRTRGRVKFKARVLLVLMILLLGKLFSARLSLAAFFLQKRKKKENSGLASLLAVG